METGTGRIIGTVEGRKMTEGEARRILGDRIQPDGGLSGSEEYLGYWPGAQSATLDGDFTADELEAIAWVMRDSIAKWHGHPQPKA